jgi:hypothetical protein
MPRPHRDQHDPKDPAWAPVEEAGGGESEGFELAEADLINHAEALDDEAIPRRDPFRREPEEPTKAVYGEADAEPSTEMPDTDR